MFIAIGIATTIYNIKNKNIDFKNLLKINTSGVHWKCLWYFSFKIIDEKILRNCFYLFMVIIGFYEIFSSLKTYIKLRIIKSERSDFMDFAKGAIMGIIAGTVVGVMNSSNIMEMFQQGKNN